MGYVTGKAQFGTGFEDFGHQIKILLIDKAALVVAFFWPRVRVQNEQAVDTGGGEGLQNFDSIIIMNADIGEVLFLDKNQKPGNAIDEWLAADDTRVRVLRGLPGQMLAAAKTDFQPYLTCAGREQFEWLKAAFLFWQTKAQSRQQFVVQTLFAQRKSWPPGAAVNLTVTFGNIGHIACL